MGFLDKFKGVKKPDEGTPALPAAQVRERLMGLNDDRVPFTVEPDAEGDADLVAEWKIVDAQWYEIFAKAGLDKAHRILLVLDEAQHEVRVLEQSWDVEWRTGVPSLSLSAEKFTGRTLGSKEFGKAVGFTGVNPLEVGTIYEYRFDVGEMKDPIAGAVTTSGWTYVPVLSEGKLRG